MGASSYRSSSSSLSYDGKGSISSTTRSNERQKSSMVEMLELLEEVERCREAVADREKDLNSAKRNLEKAEEKVKAQINKLDPETKARLRRMMGAIGDSEPGNGERE